MRDYNQKQPEYFRGLIEPADAERVLNGYKLKAKRNCSPDLHLNWYWQAERNLFRASLRRLLQEPTRTFVRALN